jgi:hypothetical protein
MSRSEIDHPRIERYLLAEMSLDERAAFEAECSENQALATALENEKKIHLLIRIHNQAEIRKQVRALEAAAKASPKTIRFHRLRRTVLFWGSIAAILLVAVGFWWSGQVEGFSNVLNNITRGTAMPNHPAIRDLIQRMELEQFSVAAVVFLQLPDSLARQPEVKTLGAQTMLRLGRLERAKELATSAMGDAATAVSGNSCYAKYLLVQICYRQNDLRSTRALLAYTPDDQRFAAQWKCLQTGQRDSLADFARTLPE